MLNTIARWATAAAALLAALPAAAQTTRLDVGYVPAADWLPALVAKDKGFFDKRQLDVTLTKVAIISNVPAAILSGSLTIAVSTPTVLLDATQAGLGLSALAGGTRFLKEPATLSLVARQGVEVRTARDLEGKRVGVPGLRSVVDVLLRKWLLDKGAQVSKVAIVEAPFSQMKDLLKGGTLDAVAVLEPFRSRIVADGIGHRVSDYVAEVSPDLLGGAWIAKSQWLQAHPQAARAFRDALTEAIAFIGSHPEEARAIEAKYLGTASPFVLPYSIAISPADLQAYVSMAREVGYLKGSVDVSRIIFR